MASREDITAETQIQQRVGRSKFYGRAGSKKNLPTSKDTERRDGVMATASGAKPGYCKGGNRLRARSRASGSGRNKMPL